MPEFPLTFEVNAQANPGVNTNWTANEKELSPINCSIPPIFHGPGGGYSPEGLLGMSVLSCIIALYKIHCEKNNISFSNLSAKATLTMNHATSGNTVAITEIDFSIQITGASDNTKAKEILEKAIHNCPIGNSLKCGKTFNIEVN